MSQNSVLWKKISDDQTVSGHRFRSTTALIAILTLFTVFGLLYDLTVPFFEKPDELKHFAVIQYIKDHHRLPVVRPGVYKAWDQEGTQPPLYHLLAAAVVSWLDLSSFEEPPRNPHYVDDRSFIWRERGNNNLYLHPPGETWSPGPVFLAARLSRWLSLLAGLMTVFLTYRLARLVFGPDPDGIETAPSALHLLPLLAAALVAFVPQFLHVSTAITNDSLATTLAAATLLVLGLIVKRGGSTRYAVYLGLGLGLGAITKLSLLYLVPLAGLVLLFDWRRHRSVGRLVVYGAITGGWLLLLSGWWYWRNWQLYGDVTALNAHLLYRGGPLDPRPTLAQLWQTELTGLELSFWAAFGAGQILLEPWLYDLLRGVKYLVGLGLVIGFWRLFRNGNFQTNYDQQPTTADQPHPVKTNPPALILVLLLTWFVIVFAALLRWMQITPASWGRLLYPALPAIAVLTTWSLSQFRIPRTLSSTSSSPLTNSQSPISTSHPQTATPPSALTSSQPPVPSPQSPRPNPHFYPVSLHPSSLILPLLLLTALFLLALISPFRYTNAAYAKTPLISKAEIPVEEIQRLGFVYDDALRLIGYRVERSSVRPGEWLPVTLYWQAIRPIDKNYSTFVHLLGSDHTVVGQVNSYPDQGNWPTSMLEPGKVLKDTTYVPVSPGAETPAVIRLALGIFEFDDPSRAAKVAVSPAGKVIEPIVGAVPLLPYEWPPLHPAQPLEANFAGQIRLAGFDWLAAGEKIKPGQTIPLTLYWEPLASPGQDFVLFIHLVDPAPNTQVAGFDGPPDFPTRFWQPGYTLIDSRLLPIPPDLPPGEYDLRIGWYNLDTLARLPLVDGPGDSVRLMMVDLSR